MFTLSVPVQFSWSVMDSEGKIWAKGTVATEEQTSLLEKEAYMSQRGVLCRLVW